jgi:hypothetical protein
VVLAEGDFFYGERLHVELDGADVSLLAQWTSDGC